MMVQHHLQRCLELALHRREDEHEMGDGIGVAWSGVCLSSICMVVQIRYL